MNSEQIRTVLGLSALSLCAIVCMSLPRTMPTVHAYAPPDTIRLTGIVRDFLSAHSDFEIVPGDGYGHYVGNLAYMLGDDYRPVFVGTGGGSDTFAPVASGTYTGDATDGRAIVGVGFRPDFLMIKGDDAEPAICRTSTMSGDASRPMAVAQALFTNRIESLDANGFTIGSDDDVNEDGKTFYWVAFEATAAVLDVGSYTGNGNASRTITGPGFQPDLVFVVPEGTRFSTQGSSAMPVGHSTGFDATGLVNDRITDFTGSGFGVGSSNEVNRNGDTYHYVAWKAVDGYMDVGGYAGDGTDDRDVLSAGFRPRYAMVKADASYAGVHTSLTLCDDDTMYFEPTANTANAVQLLSDTGFQVGSSNESNRSDTNYYWAAFRSDAAPDWGNVTGGFKVNAEWRDKNANPIAPHVYGKGALGGDAMNNFVINNQVVIPDEDFAVQVTVLGAAIQNNDYHRPVTMQIKVGTTTFEPVGPYAQPVEGNLNDDQSATNWQNPGANPRQAVLPGEFPTGTAITILGKSWEKNDLGDSGFSNSHWSGDRVADTDDNSIQIKVLRNGDTVPNIDGVYSQGNVASFVGDYVDICSGLMSMAENEIIFLYELGTDGGDESADFQDLVVVLTLGTSPGYFPGGTSNEDGCGAAITDAAGTAGPQSTGGIASATSYGQWFRDAMGINMSKLHTVTLTNNGMGVYEFMTDSFYPVDEQLLGNEGRSHNYHFTYAISASFEYDDCVGQFFEFEGTDDAWLFIHDKLAMDLGGILPGTEQHVAMDRLGLTDGETYLVRFFFANRQSSYSMFRMRTNIPFTSDGQYPLSGTYD